MSESDDEEKEYEPSQKKLDDARKKGDIARSQDLNTAASYFGLLVGFSVVGLTGIQSLGGGLSYFLQDAAQMAEDSLRKEGASAIVHPFRQLISPLILLLAIPMITALLCILAQRSLVFAPNKVAPKLSKISLISNAKQKFGRSGLFEFAKSFAKLLLFSIVLLGFVILQIEDIVSLVYFTPSDVIAQLANYIDLLLIFVLVITLCVGALDFFFQQAENRRKNRMSHRDLKEEMRQSDGDPTMKQQRWQRGQAIAMNQMMADVPKADVVLVNPTHFAVALQWDRKSSAAPKCVAKGVDVVALRIKTVALEANVPIYRDPPTTRMLHANLEIGDEILPLHYKAVAAAIRYADKIRSKARG